MATTKASKTTKPETVKVAEEVVADDEAKGAPEPEASDSVAAPDTAVDADLLVVQGSASTLAAWEASPEGQKWIADNDGTEVANKDEKGK